MTANPLSDRAKERTSDTVGRKVSRDDLYGYARRLNDSGFSRANNWHWYVHRRQLDNGEPQYILERRDAKPEEMVSDKPHGAAVAENGGSR